MSFSSASVPPFLLDQPVEAWARYYLGQLATADEPSHEPFETDSVRIDRIFGPENESRVAVLVLERIAELHERYAEWTSQYSVAQLDQGLWAMFAFPGGFDRLLIDDAVPFDPRARAMRALFVPYREYVQGWNPDEEMPQGWNMLWDGIFYGEELSRDIADVGLECLWEILALDDRRCQEYALHGLNHLKHPGRSAIVQTWIDAHRGEDWNWRWVEACRDGKAM